MSVNLPSTEPFDVEIPGCYITGAMVFTKKGSTRFMLEVPNELKAQILPRLTFLYNVPLMVRISTSPPEDVI